MAAVPRTESPVQELTPQQCHYLKRELIRLQVVDEVSLVLTHKKFDPPTIDRLAFLKFIFHYFVETFPFLAKVDSSFYPHKVKPFLESLLNLNTSNEQENKLVNKLERYMSLILASAVKLTEKEDIIRLDSPSNPPAQPNSFPMTKRQVSRSLLPTPPTSPEPKIEPFKVNVSTIRTVSTKGRLRTKQHEEFIIQTTRPGTNDVFVSRRYREFFQLSDDLRAEFPEASIMPPPAKDKRTTDAPGAPTDNEGTTSPLARERNRLTLRAYLHSVLAISVVNASQALQNFLLANPVQLTAVELEDVRRREELDKSRETSRAAFSAQVDNRVKELERSLNVFKHEIIEPGGLKKVFGTLQKIDDIRKLPAEYQRVVEWARISLASTIYTLYLGSDDSSTILAQTKRIHGMLPYMLLRGILQISNPVAMIRAFLNLFLARPFGAPSLLQRMAGSGIENEVKELRADLAKVATKIGDEQYTQRIDTFVEGGRLVLEDAKGKAAADGVELMQVILLRPYTDIPPLSPEKVQKVLRGNRAYVAYIQSRQHMENPEEEDEGPDEGDDDAWFFEDAHLYFRMSRRVWEKEQMLNLIFEGSTSELLKDIVTIFYEPLAKVYKAANIADSLYDLQAFMNDLIKTVEAAELSANVEPPAKIVQTFIDLVARHESAFYDFVHKVHTKGADLFDSLMEWIELFVIFIRDGISVTKTPISITALLPQNPKERAEFIAEIDTMILYHRKLKAHHMARLKMRVGVETAGVEGLSENVMAGLQLDDSVLGGVRDMADESDSDDSDTEDFVGQRRRKYQKRQTDADELRPPTLKRIPEMVPVFIAMIEDSLRERVAHMKASRPPPLPKKK